MGGKPTKGLSFYDEKDEVIETKSLGDINASYCAIVHSVIQYLVIQIYRSRGESVFITG